MKILLIEDDPNKSKQLLEFLRAAFPPDSISERRSYSSGLKEIRDTQPDIVLLDMSLPNFDPDVGEDSGRFRSYGGRDVMQQIKRRRLPIKVIIVTMFGAFSTDEGTVSLRELSAQLNAEFPSVYVGTIYYDASGDAWREALLNLIKSQMDGA
jgi:DNA-binding NarL/FixJ family response regulator